MLAALTALSLVVATADPPKELSEAAQKELKKLESKWKLDKIVIDGKEESPPANEAEMLLEFKGRKVLVADKELFEIPALDPSTDPKCIDLKALESMGEITKDTIYESIFKLGGDTLVMAIHIGGTKKRPDKFESVKDSGVVVVTLKRVKE
jgi:uncharacterized protein (TIGR03067 family)